MKKIVISSIIIFLISTAVFADFNENDLLFSNDTNISLYPEINYEKNPAVLQSIRVPFIFTSFEFDGSYEYEKNERIDASVGEAGGTEFIYSLSLLPALSFSYFSPGEDGKVFGYNFFYSSEHEISGTDSLDYNDPSENDSLSEVDQVFTGGVDFYLAFPGKKTKKNDAGFSLGYELTYDPVYFSWITDKAVNPTLSYVQTSSDEDDTNEFVHQLKFDYGMVLPKDKFDLSFGLNCTGVYADRNSKYMPYD
jgi:hypothetical protein